MSGFSFAVDDVEVPTLERPVRLVSPEPVEVEFTREISPGDDDEFMKWAKASFPEPQHRMIIVKPRKFLWPLIREMVSPHFNMTSQGEFTARSEVIVKWPWYRCLWIWLANWFKVPASVEHCWRPN